MKQRILPLILFIFCLATIACAADGYYVLKAIEYKHTFFALWGSTENGNEFENRYDAILFEIYENNKKISEISAYQHWFQKDRKEYPKFGESITVKKFNYKINDLALPNGDKQYNIDYNKLEIINKTSNQ